MIRAAFVVLLVATPSLLLPDANPDGRPMVVAVALCLGAITFVEYTARFPSLVEFRFAPPFNRLRFLTLFANVVLLSLLVRGLSVPSPVTELVTGVGILIGQVIDFPFSPVRLAPLMLPADAPYAFVELLRAAVGVSYLSSLMTVGVFAVLMRLYNWPSRTGAFNVWINMPNFDPTAGGDVVDHLIRDSRINVMLGLALPFVVPLFAMVAIGLFKPDALINHHTMIWTVAIWAFLPAGLIMRGIALARIADMLQRKRNRSDESGDAEYFMPV